MSPVTVSMSGTSYVNLSNTITAVFRINQSLIPTLGSCLNGIVSNISGSGTTYTFVWTPINTNTTSFNFTGVTYYTGTLTSSNQLTPLAQTTVILSGIVYDNYNNIVTATFSNLQNQSNIPSLGTCSNGVVSGIYGSGTVFNFTWNPTTTNATSLNFTNVTGYNGTLTSINSIIPIAAITVTISTNLFYTGINNTVTAIFSRTTSIPNLGSNINGIVSNISGSGTTYTFLWKPNTTIATSFTFTNISNYTGTLISTNQLTPLAITTVYVYGTAHSGIGNTITAIFSNNQSLTPSLGSCLNGVVSNISGSGTTYTFSWTPVTTTATSFNFTNVTGYTGTLTSNNQITPS